MIELVILISVFLIMVVHELVRAILVNATKLVHPDMTKGIFQKNRVVVKWSKIIQQQKGRFGIGTTVPYMILVFLAFLISWITFIVSVDYFGIFYFTFLIFSITIIMTITSLQFSFKKITEYQKEIMNDL